LRLKLCVKQVSENRAIADQKGKSSAYKIDPNRDLARRFFAGRVAKARWGQPGGDAG